MIPDSFSSILCCLGCSYQTGTNSPDWFIGNQHLLSFFFAQISSNIIYLTYRIIKLNPPASLGYALPYAENGMHTGCQNRPDLINQVGIIIRMILAPLGMPHQNISTTQLSQHISRYITGEGSLRGH